jgi:hypothetical protein
LRRYTLETPKVETPKSEKVGIHNLSRDVLRQARIAALKTQHTRVATWIEAAIMEKIAREEGQ